MTNNNLDLNEIINVDFPEDQYFKNETPKNQIVLHHTVGSTAESAISWWKQTPEKVATAVVIDKDGKIYQLYSSMYWAYHLGVHVQNSVELNKNSIGIEIVSWGALMESDNKWYPIKWDDIHKVFIPDTRIKPIQNVQLYLEGFKDFKAYEKYTNEQIESVRKLLVYWGEKYKIPLTYRPEMWNLSQDALSGIPAVFTHCSYRVDKSDCHPQPELIEMLKSLV